MWLLAPATRFTQLKWEIESLPLPALEGMYKWFNYSYKLNASKYHFISFMDIKSLSLSTWS